MGTNPLFLSKGQPRESAFQPNLQLEALFAVVSQEKVRQSVPALWNTKMLCFFWTRIFIWTMLNVSITIHLQANPILRDQKPVSFLFAAHSQFSENF